MDTKVCSSCKVEKSVDNFNKNKCKHDGLTAYCKDCRKIEYNKYRSNNLDKERLRKRIYETNNRDKINNKRKLRRQKDIEYKLKLLYRRMLSHGMKNNKLYPSLQYLGCSITELKNHLQQTAINNGYLNFDINNYSGKEFHIDHIRPCASFNLTNEEQQKECYHYTNLQILDAKTNIIKSDKY